jgi:DNA processing protein
MTGQERVAWLALTLTRGIGPERLQLLLEACHSAYGAISAPFAFLRTIPGLPEPVAEAISPARMEEAAEITRQTERVGGALLLPGDPHFPDLVVPLEDAPLCLFASGDLDLLHRPAVAIVGSRDHSAYGREVCAEIAGRAAAAGLVVVSGMARGLDAVAHEAALRAGGSTTGVLGNGLGVIYPAANRRLYRDVGQRGLLLTEHPPGMRPSEGSFPRRNRIIAALARVTVVVEAAASSGALITARVANDLSRDVMAVPGPITSSRSVGTNRLIQDGAYPLLTIQDLLTRYPEAAGKLRALRPRREEASLGRDLLQALADGPHHADHLAGLLGRSAREILAALGALEIEGLVRQEPGLRFALAAGRLAAEADPPTRHRPYGETTV